jgi:hypothetical protein
MQSNCIDRHCNRILAAHHQTNLQMPVSTKYRYVNLQGLTVAVIRNAMNQDLKSMLLQGDLDLRLTVSSSNVEGSTNRNIERRSSRSDGNLEISGTYGDWDNDIDAAELAFFVNWM